MTDERVEQESSPERSPRQALTTALGLPADTFLLELLLNEVGPTIVRCHYYPTPEAIERAVVVFAEYQLVAKPPPPPEEPMRTLPPVAASPGTQLVERTVEELQTSTEPPSILPEEEGA
jgi:hypothetical protein